MGQEFRLARGGRIDRRRAITMRFDGRPIEAYAGDTIASALLANGIHFIARSFKYHRPRGIFSHGSEEPSALLTIDRGRGRIDPNSRAPCVEAVEGLSLTSQNHWPSLAFDLGAVNGWLAPLFAAGFYYKTFMWPRAFWSALYEPLIRAAAGLGRVPEEADPDHYDHNYAHCEVLVVGAGPAGLAAALAASAHALRVIVADEQAEMGGALLHDVTSTVEGTPAWPWLEATLARLAARGNVTLLPRTTAFGYYNHNHLGLLQRLGDSGESPPGARERLWQVRALEVVLATGAHERPLVFADNDRPGIMLAESLRAYANRYGVAAGRRAVIATTQSSAYAAAADLKAAGIEVTVVDRREEAACARDAAGLRALGCEVLSGHTPVGSLGSRRLRALKVARVGVPGAVARARALACDCAGVSGGWTPAVHLFSQARGKLAFQDSIDAFVPALGREGPHAAGAILGSTSLADCLAQGYAAGEAAAHHADRAPARALPVGSPRPAPGHAGASRRAFVDLQNDVTVADIELALSEGFAAIEHVKRYTTAGMGTDQGKTSNMEALHLVAARLGKAVPAVGTTTFRPPYTPVTFAALAGPHRGALFDPVRTTPMHAWAAARGAVFEDVGLWKRARYFPRSGESMQVAVDRECQAVRAAAGIFDASTLGKIEVVGRDAAEFLNRIYTGALARLEPGRCRYALLLKEDGYIFDDGVVARLAQDRFHVTTTTGGAARTLQHMEDYLQTEWAHLAVHLVSISEHYAVIAVQGPRAREILAPLVEGLECAEASFPFMAVREAKVAGVACRLFRISFTGELGYEINAPADHAADLSEALVERGGACGMVPYGTEAMHVLRAEKGFIVVGQETDGTVAPDDVGLGGLVAWSKPDFVGRRSLQRPDLRSPQRPQLVGIWTEDAALVLDEGAQLVADASESRLERRRSLGHVTSSYFSANCGRSIALALLEGGRSRLGQRLYATTQDGFAAVEVRSPVFLDRRGVPTHG
jgi:sarcosine oxidase subunit alpha